MIEIGPLPGHDQSRAHINADGVIVGESWSDEEGLAFVWRDGVMTVLPPATGYDRSAATYANATGLVIGTSEDVYTEADPDEFVDFTVWPDGRVGRGVGRRRRAHAQHRHGTRYEFQLMSFRMEEGVWVNARYSNMTFITTATQ